MVMPTLIETLRKAEEYLAAKGIPSPRLEAQLLFAHFLGLKRIELFTQPERPLVTAELDLLRAALRRRVAGEPMAYILGERDFFGRTFMVTPAVLIPRPETEELVEQVLALRPKARHIADAGTGSGCIGITLAVELGAAELTLLDLSAEALQVAMANANKLLDQTVTRVHALCTDFCVEKLSTTAPVDLIVSNPPYVLPEELATLDKSVRDYEPRMALVAENFEKLHRGLIDFAWRHLAAGGILALETHPQKSSAVAGWLYDAGFVRVEVRNDLAARPHFVLAWK